MHARLLRLTRDSRVALILTILSGFLVGLLTIWQAWLLSSAINGVFLESQTLIQVSSLLRLLLIAIGGRAALTWLNEISANAVAVRVKTDLRQRLFAHILELGPAYARGERTGELTAAAVEGVEALDAYFSQYLPQLVITALVPISILVVVFPIDLLSGIVFLVTAPLIPFFMIIIGKGAEIVTKRQYDTLRLLSAHFLDSIQGLTTLKLFGQSKAQTRTIAQVSDKFRDTTLSVLRVTFLSALALELLATISVAIIAVEIGLRLLYAKMGFHEALFLLVLAPEFYMPLRMLGARFHAGMSGTTAAKRIFEILDTPIENHEKNAENNSPKTLTPVFQFSTLKLSTLSYTYPGETAPALDQISLEICAGQHIALVGASGAGKTTLANILLRFLKPQSGQILVNEKPLDEIDIDSWRGLLAWVPQKPYLFHDTIAANIRLGNLTATDEQVAEAARAAHLDDVIKSLPQQYETIIGEGGARLSSGQAQRLALARAFLKDAPILILDEPTSSLDPETESLLEESTRHLMQSRTVITIAHRLNTVFQADQIVVLESGHIAESGTHQELLATHGAYAHMIAAYSELQIESPQPPAISSTQTSTPMTHVSVERDSEYQNHPSKIFLRLLSFLNGSWPRVALSVLLGALTIGSSVALMGTSAWLISEAALHPSIAVLEVAIVGVRFFGITRGVFRYLERLVSHDVTFRLLSRLRVWFYEKLEPLAPARLMEYRAGDLLARIVGDVETLENFYVRVVSPPLTAILVALGVSIFLASFDPRLVLVFLVFFLSLGLFLPILSQIFSRHSGTQIINLRADLHVRVVDGIQGMADLLAYGRAENRLDEIAVNGKSYGNAQRRMAQVTGFYSGLSALLTNLGLWSILVFAIPQVTAGKLDGAMLASLGLLTLASFEAVTPLPLAAQMWNATREAARRLFDVVDARPAVEDHVQRAINDNTTSNIELSDLSFTYPSQPESVLQHISFELKSGRSIAIVGPSGAGKSTLANLLLRFWEYSSGEIRLDGESLNGYTQDEVRARIGFVSQNTYFFNTSIFENLRFARRHVTRDEVESAARLAQIHDFILSLPKGYDTLIGEQGTRLSGGERQRLAIARAILKDAPILILDEPTANLDPLTEKRVLETLFGLMKNKTSLLITHRLVGLENVDEILVMNHGQIVERGAQAQLIDQNGLYRRLLNMQNRIFTEPMEVLPN